MLQSSSFPATSATITTDHISPAGAFRAGTPAGKYLVARGISSLDFNSYGSIRGLSGEIKPRQKMQAEIVFADGRVKKVPLLCRIDTLDEVDYFKNGGILRYVLRNMAAVA